MNDKPVKMTNAQLVNESLLTVHFSDDTAALFTVEALLACAETRFAAHESLAPHQVLGLQSQMPESKLVLALADNLRISAK